MDIQVYLPIIYHTNQPNVGKCTVRHMDPTWRIIKFSKWLITMVSKSPNWGCSPYKWPKWLINRGDPNHLLTGVILQVWERHLREWTNLTLEDQLINGTCRALAPQNASLRKLITVEVHVATRKASIVGFFP